MQRPNTGTCTYGCTRNGDNIQGLVKWGWGKEKANHSFFSSQGRWLPVHESREGGCNCRRRKHDHYAAGSSQRIHQSRSFFSAFLWFKERCRHINMIWWLWYVEHYFFFISFLPVSNVLFLSVFILWIFVLSFAFNCNKATVI